MMILINDNESVYFDCIVPKSCVKVKRVKR